MKFLTTGEKVKKLREQLNLTQDDLVAENVTRGLISMIETGRRDISYKTAVRLAEKFNGKAEELNIILNIDEGYLMRSPSEDAEIYCLNKLKNEDITQSTIDEIWILIKQYDLLEVQAKTYFKFGEIDLEKKNFDKACANYDQAIKIYKSMGKNEKLGYIYERMGISKTRDLKYDTAIVYYGLSQYYSFVYDDKATQRLCLYNLANNYKKTNEIDLALETVEKCLLLCEKKEDIYIYAYNIKAQCYESKGEYDRAIDIYNLLLEEISDNKNSALGYVYNNLGLNYCHKNDFKESIKCFEMAENILNELDKSLLSHTIIEKSHVLLKQKLTVQAVTTVKLGLKYAKEYSDIEYLLKGNYILADIYDNLNDTEQLEEIYLKIVDLLKLNKEYNSLKSIYNKLAIMYLNQDKTDLCKKYLLLSKDLD